MASRCFAAVLLVLALHSFVCAGAQGDKKDYGYNCPQGEDFTPISKEDLQALLEEDLKSKASESDTSGGEKKEELGLWSWLAHLNGAGSNLEESKGSERAAFAADVSGRRKGGMHKGKKGMHPLGTGMRPPGKGMHGKRPVIRPPVVPSPNSPGFRPDLVVAKDGTGQYLKVQAAINAASRGTESKRFVIYIKGGDYNEKCLIPYSKQWLLLVGDKGKTRIFYDDAAATLSGSSKTARSASVSILADDFMAVDITFENTYGWPNGREGSQAVAVLVNSDRAQFYGCTFMGHQDTLFSIAGTQYFYKCHIIGQVDFIFGNALALYHECLIEVINNAVNRYTAVAAQNRPSEDYNSGFVFLGGRLLGTGASFPEYGVLLGRTWGPWSTVVYTGVQMDCPVRPVGWDNMGQSDNENNAILLGYGNTGIGANMARWDIGRAASAAEITKYNGLQFIGGRSWVTIPSWWRA
eukprot:TRINITY_DN4593_c0_g1_i1.p1 TRINITY_DN4593_c0_g1~~TRINITY_DN4593_c0_g1_i1.p1  ORF type:complete len:466 (-),score=86.50 TRINITY_DN4593_c0_g1_i1:717-2114(-)